MYPPHHVGLREDQVSLRTHSTPQEANKRNDFELIWSITSHSLSTGKKCENLYSRKKCEVGSWEILLSGSQSECEFGGV